MSVLRRLARRLALQIRQLWPHLRQLQQSLAQRCSPLVDGARSFFVMEGFGQAASKSVTQSSVHTRRRTAAKGGSHTANLKRSTGQILLLLGRQKTLARGISQENIKRTWIVTLLSLLLLSACFGQRFYNQPGLDVKSIAPQTFYAPETVVFEDKQETERQRSDVRDGAVPVLKIDSTLTAEATASLETLLRQGRELRMQAGSPPLTNLEALSRPTQDVLFQASDSQWKAIWRLAENQAISAAQLAPSVLPDSPSPEQPADSSASPAPNPPASNSPASNPPALPQKIALQVRSLLPDQVTVLQELLAYRDVAGVKGLAQLKVRVDVPRQQYRQAAAELALAASTDGQPLYNYRLFELSEDQWQLLELDARQIFSEMMLQGVSQGMPPDLLRRAIEARVNAIANVRMISDEQMQPIQQMPQIQQIQQVSPVAQQLTADVIAMAMVPNLVLDELRTKQRAEQAVKEIVPVLVSVQKGDVIVKEGDTLDATDFVKLDYFGFSGRYFNWQGLCGFSLLVASAIAFYLWVDHLQAQVLNRRDHLLILVLCLVVALLAFLRVPTMGIPAVGILVASFYGSALGLAVVGLLTLVVPVGVPVLAIPLVAGAAAAMLGTWIAPQLRAREEFALLGGFVGIAQASVHLILTLMRSTAAAPLWKVVFLGSAMHGLYGIAWSVVALGVSPYLEHFFDVVTPIRLAELANPNRPLLKRLAAEAPGTFQHTMFVSNLAEAAARALGRNVELVRAGTLYHDIGKMHDPQGFIENQMSGPNKHDAINDPWQSASIIRKHVTQGLVMARKYRLPKAVQAFIPEHQGDMRISYFYQQAKERQAAEPSLVVNEADFRYDGPIPQSPETGITMLADSCEAALRSLNPDASMDDAYSMVDKILRARWRSRQLAESGLTRDEMDVIASVFIQVWQQHNHKRIAYPKEAA